MRRLSAPKWLALLGLLVVSINAGSTLAPPAIADLNSRAARIEMMAPACDPTQLAELREKIVAARELANRLSAELKSYKVERTKYDETLSTLRSALFASIIAALGVVGGWVVTSLNAKTERDLKRLNIIEKVRDLKDAGLGVPSDIELRYMAEAAKDRNFV